MFKNLIEEMPPPPAGPAAPPDIPIDGGIVFLFIFIIIYSYIHINRKNDVNIIK